MKRAWPSGIGALLLPTLAFAQGTPAPGPAPAASDDSRADPGVPAGVHVVDDREVKPPTVPPSSDLLGGHLLIGAAVGPTWSLGELGSTWNTTRGLGTGLSFGLDAGYGVSRSTVLGLRGSFAVYGNGTNCGDSCSGKGLSVGPFVRYHLSQGFRFDPWLAFGTSFRRVTHDDSGALRTFHGLEWLHLELGADYYLFSGLGLGPYLSLGETSYWRRPDAAGSASVNTELSFGLRLLFDSPGR